MPQPRPAPSLPKSYNDIPWKEIKTEHYVNDPSIIILTLWRPKNHNAFTGTMMLELEEAYALFDIDDRVKCIVFTATGTIFCAGADLEIGFGSGLAGEEAEKVQDHRDGYVIAPILLSTYTITTTMLLFMPHTLEHTPSPIQSIPPRLRHAD